MSISCSCEAFDPEWWYLASNDFSVLETKRSRKCCSCKKRVAPGADVLLFARWRDPKGDIEDRIYGDEVPLAPWFMCETCGGLYMAIEDLDMCCDICEDMAEQIREYRMYGEDA